VTGDEIGSRGGWVEIGWQAAEWYALTLGFSTDDPDDDDLNPGGRDLNRIFYLANRFSFGPVEFGADLLFWRTDFVDFDDGSDVRFNLYAAFKF
jgi:hypothetical protein